jgi:hypothetical protein
MNTKMRYLLPVFAVSLLSMCIFAAYSYCDDKGYILRPDYGFGVFDDGTIVVGTSNHLIMVRGAIVRKTKIEKLVHGYVIGPSGIDIVKVYSPSGSIYSYDNNGNLVDTNTDKTYKRYFAVKKVMNRSIQIGDRIYSMRSTFGYTSVILYKGQEQSICYKESLFSYVCKIILALTMVGFIFTTMFSLFRSIRLEMNTTRKNLQIQPAKPKS